METRCRLLRIGWVEIQKSLSRSVPVYALVAAAFPARSVGPAAGVQLALATAAAVVGTPLGIPSVMVRLEPLLVIVETVPVRPNVIDALKEVLGADRLPGRAEPAA
jgi:hypothetical protein